ncbi:anaerobic carbon-monoxide dehydrogenase catalytic subunit [Clostridium thermobutyricum]|uniref:anaerobic carbon-monoxide dehydrogenase n=1 Tax=Clostridium thermobutyricum DSM 4928 TaxID=1121339 RepID=A0A1V4SXP3_9CLOT|nr:anaerobic carbon-monoxide dehydrogenase catalytic subunit [Clostridium thermobutyricum]OPX49503.1 carbon monoxide dehydrogenase 2 [Clostridium thermobutyricum DSM 4928]
MDNLNKNNHEHINEHQHDHNHEHHHQHGGVKDYMTAVAEYRKTFASKQDVIDKTPDPAVRDMILRMEQIGCSTAFDRFDTQKPQCSFGLAGVCCRICNMGPCKITPKSPRGVCGADADLIVARNMLRSLAGGTAAHGAHGREVILALRYAAEGKLNLPILGKDILINSAKKFGLETEGKTINQIAIELSDVLLDDMSRSLPGEYKTIKAFAPEERQKVWSDMDILPISAYHEVFESLHRTNEATDGDWKNIMKEFGRCGLTFLYSGVVAPAIATDSLFGPPIRKTSKVNVGALEEGYVNIAVHGHLPILVSEIVKQGQSEEFIKLAKEKGAKGIKFYGICCTGLSSMYRYNGVIPLSNSVGAELVLGTGALDLWVADVQDVFPGIMDVARCFKTTVVTTSDSARLPGAEHYAYDHHHSNISETENLARKIVTRAIESFTERRDIPVFIPPYEVDAEVGFSYEYLEKEFGSMKPIADAIKSGKILGIVNLVGCCNPRVVYERAIVDIADKLLENNILILTNGCASFPLLKLGFCNKDALRKAGDGLKSFLGENLPPVWHVGECVDNTRSSEIFGGVAEELGIQLKDMPYGLASPEWANEKGIGASYSFRLMGINSYHCVYPPAHGSENVMNFILDSSETLGSKMNIDVDPIKLADKIISDFKEKRAALGWDK